VPPLRERRGDILELARYFLERHRPAKVLRLSASASDALEAYDWPGNVRELERVIERVVTMTPSGPIQLGDLPASIRGPFAEAVAPALQELSIRVNQSCHLVVRAGNQALVILRQENQQRHANLSVRLGAAISLVASCSGQVLLAHMDRDERESVLRTIPRPWPISRAKLDSAMARIGKRGFELQKSPMTAGVTDISYPIRGFDGNVVAALTVPYLHVLDHSLPTSVEQTRQLMADATRRISQALGAPRPPAGDAVTSSRRSVKRNP
jgi:DNA-binding IclR family transcriptional regulator